MGQVHQPGHGFAQGAVSPGTDHSIEIAAQLPGDTGGVSLGLGGIGGYKPAVLGEHINGSGQVGPGVPFAGSRIIN